MKPRHGHWQHDEGAVTPLSLGGVRDLIVECFTDTHGPRFAETRSALGLEEGREAVRSSVQGIVRLAYTIAGGSYDLPTIETTVRVVNLLSERSIAWGVPEDDVFEHHCVMMRVLGQLLLSASAGVERPAG